MKKSLWVVALIPVLLMAGCTESLNEFLEGGTGGGGKIVKRGEGVSTEFAKLSVDVESIEPVTPGSTFTVSVDISNEGDSNAENVKASLKRFTGDFNVLSEDCTSSLLEKKSESPLTCEWDVEAGERSGDLILTLTYDYQSRAEGDILVYNLEDASIKEEAESASGVPSDSFKGTAAPIVIVVNETKPVTYKGTPKTASYEFDLVNPNEEGRVSNVKVTIKIGDEVCVDKELSESEVKKLNSGERTWKKDCKFTPPQTDSKTSVPFSVEVKYTYREDREIYVEVSEEE